MDSTDKIILLIAGIGFAVGVAFYVLRPKTSAITYKVVQSNQPFTASQEVTSNEKVRYENEETWTWTDWKGREREIVVHRKVKEIV
jgi:hypothetical protein